MDPRVAIFGGGPEGAVGHVSSPSTALSGISVIQQLTKVVHMKRAFILGAALAAVLTVSTPLVRGQGVPDRPEGVAAGAWIPLNARLGFVVATEPSHRAIPNVAAQPLLLAQPVAGYFMVKGATGWSRVVMADPVKGPGGAG